MEAETDRRALRKKSHNYKPVCYFSTTDSGTDFSIHNTLYSFSRSHDGIKYKQPKAWSEIKCSNVSLCACWRSGNRWVWGRLCFQRAYSSVVIAAVSGINGSSSSVNMNRLWRLVRLLLRSGEVGHAKGLSVGPAPRGTMVMKKQKH